ncbi:MAG: PaaI family thioesterase [Acidimicrobiales bacterium]
MSESTEPAKAATIPSPTRPEPGVEPDPEAPPKDMSRWLGDGGMAILAAIGVSFDDYGIEDDDRAGWATAVFEPTLLACNPHRTVQAGVHSVVLDAAMNFAVNAGLAGRDRTKATVEMKTETMRPAEAGDRLAVRGAVVRQTRQIAFAEARIEDAEGNLVSRATGTFLIHRAG